MAEEIDPQFDVFISHASKDSWVAENVAVALRKEGINPFLDTWSMNAGENWRDSLSQAVGNTRSVLLIVSRASTESTWVKAELDEVLRSGSKPLLTVLLDESPLPKALENLPYLALSTADHISVKDVVDRIVTSIKTSPASNLTTLKSRGSIWASSRSIPPLDERGYLPFGTYEAPLEEVIARFGAGTPQRVKLGEDLKALESRGRSMGAEAIVLGGSFVSSQPTPNDLDIVYLIEPTNVSDLSPTDAEVVGGYIESDKSTFVAHGTEAAKSWTDLLSNRYLSEPRGVVRIAVSKAAGEAE